VWLAARFRRGTLIAARTCNLGPGFSGCAALRWRSSVSLRHPAIPDLADVATAVGPRRSMRRHRGPKGCWAALHGPSPTSMAETNFVPGERIGVACDLKCRVGNREARRGVTVETVSAATSMLRRSINVRLSTMSTAPSVPNELAWVEIGRAAPGEGAPWIVCIAPVGESGALYRTQIVDGSVVTITVDLIVHRGAPAQRVHRASCKIPPNGDALGEPVKRLVGAADEAAWTALSGRSLDRSRPGNSGRSIEHAVKPSPTASQQGTAAARQFDQPLHGP
jgi:hypothetical protein